MAVIHSTVGRVKPGRFEDLLSLVHESLKVYERFGITTGRLTLAAVAGEASGQWSYSLEFEDLGAFARFAQETSADQEMQALFSRIQAPESPAVIEQQSLATEIPLGRSPRAGRGSLVEIHVTRPTPGQLEETMALARRCCDFVEAHGAMNARVFQLSYAGIGSGLFLTSWDLADFGAWAQLGRAFETDPEGQAIAASEMGANPTSTRVFSGLYNDIPL